MDAATADHLLWVLLVSAILWWGLLIGEADIQRDAGNDDWPN